MSEQTSDNQALAAFNANVVDEFRANSGKVFGQFEGSDLLLLTTIGAKSGQRRVNPLQYLRIDGKIIVVGAYAGAVIDPAWAHNLRANPRAQVELGTQAFEVIARELSSDERRPAWSQIIEAERGFTTYQSQTSRLFPLFELTSPMNDSSEDPMTSSAQQRRWRPVATVAIGAAIFLSIGALSVDFTTGAARSAAPAQTTIQTTPPGEPATPFATPQLTAPRFGGWCSSCSSNAALP
jgi:deazaflavin-dependent oxidoreductase (nitroreductase family)